MMKKICSLLAGAVALPILAVSGAEDFTATPVMTLAPGNDMTNYSGFSGMCALTCEVVKPMPMVPADCHVQLATNGTALRIKAESELGPKGLLARLNPPANSLLVFKDDCFEFVLIPDPTNEKLMYHFFVNGKGAVYSECRENGKVKPWKLEREMKSEYEGKTWNFQLDLPLKQFGIENLKPGQAIGLRICRNWRNLNQKYYDGYWQSTWCQMRAGFFSIERLPLVCFRPDAPSVDFFRVVTPKERKQDPKFRITNTSSSKQSYLAVYKHELEKSQPAAGNLKIKLAPGESKEIAMPIPQVLGDEVVNTKLTVYSANKKTVFYHRAISWRQGEEKDFFAKSNDSTVLVFPRMAFYPSTNKMRIQVNFKAEKKLNQLKSIRAEITTADGKTIGSYPLPMPNQDKLSDTVIQLPDLKKYTQTKNPAGTYRLNVITEGLGYGPIITNFERKAFAWEDNRIGMSKRLIPPFTALKVSKGNTVDVILRTLTMDGTGLFKSIKADGEELLTRDGIVFEAVIGGKTYRAKSTAFKFVKQDDFEAVAEAEWKAGPLSAKAKCHISYDGLMWYTLQLQPCAMPIDKLSMKAVFPEQMVPLYHVCTDGLRFNNGGAMLKGNGLIWKSGDAAHAEIINDFVPYIWVGKEGPGLCIFADSDKNWVHAANVSSQEMFRKNGTIEMVWNFLANVPANTKLGEIRFGLQATPVKPMPENWRAQVTWNQTWMRKSIWKYFKQRTAFCGGDMGRGTFVNDYVPRLNDYALWKVFLAARKTGKVPEGFLDKWVAGYPNKDMHQTYRREVGFVLGVMQDSYNTDTRIMLYTNPRGVRIDTPEGATFMDDWLREEFREFRNNNVPLNTGLAYSANPIKSFQDYLIWGYKNFFDAGIDDQLYWDNVFLTGCYALSGELDNYQLPDGRIQPSVEIENIREVIRRTAVFQLERGLKPDNMAHMTNTTLIPTLSFAQQQMDWEDNDGTGPYQERYTKEYVRALSIGYQAGCLPCVLDKVSGGTEAERAFCRRTGTGVILTHEIRWASPRADAYWFILEKMFDFGYGTPAVQVYNYWKKDYPLTVEGADSTSIYLEKGNQAQILVCSYGGDADFEVALNGRKIVKAVNAETGKEVAIKDGKLQFHLPKYDLIFMNVEITK